MDLVLGAKEKFDILEYLNDSSIDTSSSIIRSDIDYANTFKPSVSLDERTRAYLKVQDGCDYTCSFCTIPMARGKSRSGTVASTIKEARKIGKSGNKEVVFSSSSIYGFLAIVLAAINIFGGFLVTQRMLAMYKKKKKDK